jgi:hypothetical protein
MPPEVPATVSAKVPLVVIGDPDTEIIPPVNDWATEVTEPPPPDVAMVIEPLPLVMDIPEPAVSVALVRLVVELLPINN